MKDDKPKIDGIWRVITTKDFHLRTDLTLEEKGLYTIIKSYADNENLTAYPSLDELARRSCKCKRTVQKLIKGLIKKGCLSKTQNVENGVFKSNIYTINEMKAEYFGLNTEGKNFTYGKSTVGQFFRYDKLCLLTIIQYINNNIISCAKELIKNHEEFTTKQIKSLSKTVNKYKSKLGKERVVKIIFCKAVDNIQFDDISDLAAYLEACCKEKGQTNNTIKSEGEWIS
ncbi:helix-turn-helix domain-containing protein [Bacteroidota bacterium]